MVTTRTSEAVHAERRKQEPHFIAEERVIREAKTLAYHQFRVAELARPNRVERGVRHISGLGVQKVYVHNLLLVFRCSNKTQERMARNSAPSAFQIARLRNMLPEPPGAGPPA
jgi:hypothetical protein